MARPRKHDGVVYRRRDSKIWWMRYRDRDGSRRLESTNTTDWDEAQQQLRGHLDARDKNSLATVRKGKQLTFDAWADFFLANYSKPPIRAPKTHEANENALKSLRPAFGESKLVDIDATQIEFHLRARLQQRKRVRRRSGVVELGYLQATSVHQEFRVLRRIFSVAVKKKLVPSNPCTSVEFPVAVKGLFRPHYMTWSEQSTIEQHASTYLRNVIRIITETGLRVYKELICLKKEQVDIANKVVFVIDSKTPTGVSEVPLTDIAAQAFQDQLQTAGPGPWLFPSSRKPDQHQLSFKKVWQRTLQRAGVRYFRIYDLRSTYATRLSAGGVADEWVTQMLRQSDAKVFKKYSQMKLQMKREALQQMNRRAGDSERRKSFDTEQDE